jgi:hypothetical protein
LKQLAALALAVSAAAPVFAGPNVGVSIGINQPGAYGRIDIGNYPHPAVVYAQPVVMTPAPVAVYQQPIYLYVPVVYQQDWGRYCGRYNACGQPVYFVQEQWVRERYRHEHEGHDERRSRRHDDDDHDHGHHRKRGRGHHGNNDNQD